MRRSEHAALCELLATVCDSATEYGPQERPLAALAKAFGERARKIRSEEWEFMQRTYGYTLPPDTPISDPGAT